MPARHQPRSAPSSCAGSPPRHAWRTLRRSALALSLLVGACGGGGGGSASEDSSPTAALSTSPFAFPFGMSWAAPTDLVAPAAVPPGTLGISAVAQDAARTPAQAWASAQADAVATGRVALSASGWLRVAALFDTSAGADAPCWSPAVAYRNHDDSPGTSGTLPAGTVSLWHDGQAGTGASDGVCAAAQVSARLGPEAARAHQAMLLLAALRARVVQEGAWTPPGASQQQDLSAPAAAALQGLLGDATIASASVAANSDGTELDYHLRLTRGSGAAAQSLDVKLLHMPTEGDTRFAGALQVALSYLSTDASQGCTDQTDGAGHYKVARLLTLGYNRQDEWLSLRARSGLYCGNGSALSASQIEELASLTVSGELDPGVFLTGGTRGHVNGWRRDFLRWGSDHVMSTQTADFLLAWQTLPQSGHGHARLVAGHTGLDTAQSSRTLMLASGHTDDISGTDGTLLGLVCNLDGPSGQADVAAQMQWQQATLGRSATQWALTASHHRYAPTGTCQASATMAFDLNGDGTLAPAEGAGTQADLVSPSAPALDPQGELAQRGFLSPVLLL